MAADIQPIAGKGLIMHRMTGLEEKLHQVREVQVFVRLNEIHHLRFKDIDTHAHQVGAGWFFYIISNAVIPVRDNHPQIDFHLALIGGNRGNAAMAAMITQAVPENPDWSTHPRSLPGTFRSTL